MYEFPPGSSGKSIFVYLRDAASGQPKPGLVASSPGAQAKYTRVGGSATAFTLVQLASATDPWTAGGFFEDDYGLYRVDVPDASLAAGAAFVAYTFRFDNALGDSGIVFLRTSTSAVGSGGVALTVTVNVTPGATPIAGVAVWVTTDSAGTNTVAGALTTNTFGQVVFSLDAGTYYLWTRLTGYTATANPTAVTVAAVALAQTLTMSATAAPPATTSSITHTNRATAHDVCQRLIDFLGSDAGENSFREARRGLFDGYRELTTAARWATYFQWGRVLLSALQTTGTVTYDHTGGSAERLLTLADGTWPDWAESGYLRISNVNYLIARLLSSTTVQLDTLMNPGADLAAGTEYTLLRDTYTLPADFVAADHTLTQLAWGGMDWIRPHEWLATVRYQQSVGTPRFYTIMGDPRQPGRMCVRIFPVPDTADSLDFLYQRAPRAISLIEYTTGKVSVNSVTAPTTVTIDGGTFTPAMVGSIIRLSSTRADLPTAPEGENPAAEERNISLYLSSTSVQVDQEFATDYTNVAFRVSDPVDVDEYMRNALYRCCEAQACIQRIMDNGPKARADYMLALRLAREADSKCMGRRQASLHGAYRQRLRDMPRADDVS